MARKNDSELVGKKFGTLTVLGFAEMRNHRSYWNVQCECGNEKIVRSDFLQKDHPMCEKCKAENQRKRMTRHGETKSHLYTTWRGIKDRCSNPNNAHSNRYFERGITMYEKWFNSYESFRDYVKSLPDYGKQGYTLDRMDNSKGYQPGNLRWASHFIQNNNTERNHLISYKGKTQTLSEWSVELKIPYTTLCSRINDYGWSIEDAFTRPIRKHTRAK